MDRSVYVILMQTYLKSQRLFFSSIFTCFFKLCKYWNEPQIITKIVCDGVYSMSINIYILLCIDYSQAFFLSLMWSNVANNLIWEEKNVWFSPQDITKWASNNNMQYIQWKMKSLKTLLIAIIIALMWRSADNFDKRTYFWRK